MILNESGKMRGRGPMGDMIMYAQRNILRIVLILFVLMILNGEVSMAQQPAKIFIGETVTIHSEILNEDRTLYIYTPPGYGYSDNRYPVLYLLDGADNFVHVSGIVHYLSAVGRIPQMIMVAIPNTRRTRDLTPTVLSEYPSSGGAENFKNFLATELIPYIDQHYKTQPYHVLAGHSLGGLFAIYTLITQPDLFGAYIAASPALGWDNGIMVDRAKSFFQKQARLDKFLYVTLGNEGDAIYSLVKEFTDTIRRTKPKDFKWEFIYMEKESHASIVHKSIYDGLEKLYADWAVSDEVAAAGLDAVLNHYRQLSERFGYTINPSEMFLNSLGYEFLNSHDFAEAEAIFQHNIKLYPQSANVYDSYGEALEKDNQPEKALANYRTAYDKARENADPGEQIFKQNYERVKALLEEED